MQLHSAFKNFRKIEEFSGPLVSVSAHQDGRLSLSGECLHHGTKWTVSLSPVEAQKLVNAYVAGVTPENAAMNFAATVREHRDVADNVTHAPLVSDADNPHFVENHR